MQYQKGPGFPGALFLCGNTRRASNRSVRFVGPLSPPARFALVVARARIENRDAVPCLLNTPLTRGMFAVANMPSSAPNRSQVPE
jgi:hypothetical protein